MELFGDGSAAGAGELARLNLKAWEAGLALRISLQKSLDICNKLPVFNPNTKNTAEEGIASDILKSRLGDMIELLETQQAKHTSKKRKFDALEADEDEVWEHISGIQANMSETWKPVVDKWHARLNYGSEKSKSKLKVLSTTIWDQIDRALSDDSLVIEKSRPLLLASKRPDKPSNEHNPSTARDEEVYDDLHFYSMLLKMLIQANISSANITEGDAEWTALQNFRKHNQRLDVDRRASKGRKIRYVVHQKLQNFMFPVQRIESEAAESMFLTSSLFQ